MGLEKITAIRGKITAARYGNPAKGLSVIAVAGPYGKTTVTRLLAGILHEANKKVTTLTSDQSSAYDVSMDAFFKQLSAAKRKGDTLVIVEVTDTLLRLGVLETIDISTLIITGDTPFAERLLKLSPRHVVVPSQLQVPAGLVEPYQHISFGDDELAEAKLESTQLYRKGIEVKLTIDHQTKLELASPLVGHANAWNLVIATAAAYVLAVDLSAVQEGIAEVEPHGGNFVQITIDRPYMVIVDGAVHESSIERAVQSARELTKRRLIVVTGDRSVSQATIELLHDKADRVFVVGSDRDVPSGVEIESSPEDATHKAMRAGKQDDIILLLGGTLAARKDDVLYAQSVVESAT